MQRANKILHQTAVVAEWLRRWTRNPLGSARTGSNPVGSDHFDRYVMVTSAIIPVYLPWIIKSCRGRVVKAMDLKSIGLCPHRFEPCRQRSLLILYYHYKPLQSFEYLILLCSYYQLSENSVSIDFSHSCQISRTYTQVGACIRCGLRGATVARLTPDQKVACSNHVGVNDFCFSAKL